MTSEKLAEIIAHCNTTFPVSAEVEPWRQYCRELLQEISALQGLVLEQRMHYAAKTICQCGRPLSNGLCRICDNDE